MGGTVREADVHRTSRTRTRLDAGRCVLGLHCFSGSASMVEAAGAGGLDFVVLDQEHSPNDVACVAEAVRAADSFGIDLFLRPAGLDQNLGAALDAGVAGLVVPKATAARMTEANRTARFAPEGERGACPAIRAGGYDVSDWPAFALAMNRELLLLALVEDRVGLSEVEAIAADPAVDGLFVGAFDLAASLGLPPGDLRSPGLLKPFDTVLEAAAKYGKPIMASAGTQDGDYGHWLREKGVKILSCGADVQIVYRVARRLRAKLEDEGA